MKAGEAVSLSTVFWGWMSRVNEPTRTSFPVVHSGMVAERE
jgi:hypothetical protein